MISPITLLHKIETITLTLLQNNSIFTITLQHV